MPLGYGVRADEEVGRSRWSTNLIPERRPMKAQTRQSEHHVVGPVHVIELHEDDTESITSALLKERDQCAAARVIIDITGFEGAMSIVLEAAEQSGWDHDIMVRTADQRHLTLEELRERPSAPPS